MKWKPNRQSHLTVREQIIDWIKTHIERGIGQSEQSCHPSGSWPLNFMLIGARSNWHLMN